MYDIETEDLYGDFSEDKEIFDFSNYSARLKLPPFNDTGKD